MFQGSLNNLTAGVFFPPNRQTLSYNFKFIWICLELLAACSVILFTAFSDPLLFLPYLSLNFLRIFQLILLKAIDSVMLKHKTANTFYLEI